MSLPPHPTTALIRRLLLLATLLLLAPAAGARAEETGRADRPALLPMGLGLAVHVPVRTPVRHPSALPPFTPILLVAASTASGLYLRRRISPHRA